MRSLHHHISIATWTALTLLPVLSLQSSDNAAVVGVIYFVTPTGAGTMDGSSWENATAGDDLQSVIDVATAGDSVWVACGIYFPTSTTNRTISFHMRNGVAIIGSFQGTETQYSQRVFTCGPCSVLSGNVGMPLLATDNSYTVIVNIGLDETAAIDGFRITEGHDDRSPTNDGNGLGGGVYNGGSGQYGEGGNCSPVFMNCVIDSNYATYGAGMFNNGHDNGHAAPRLTNCILTNNHAVTGGGGMDSYGWNNGSVAPELYNCIFYNNVSEDRAGAMYCWGGLNGNCSPVIHGCAFINNTSVNIAGGIIVDNSNDLAGNPPFTGIAEITSVNSLFWGNTSGAGPQFYILGTGHFNATHSAIDTVGQTAAHPVTGVSMDNLFVYPQLLDTMDIQGADDCWMTIDDGLTLMISSPCINAGDTSNSTSTDLAFYPRLSGSNIDIGPYEFVLADSVEWTGANGTDWFDGENWDPARVPDATQTVTIPGILTASNQPVVACDTASCGSVILQENAQLQVQQLLHVRGQ